nr:hypothetical protein [uncultured Chryseobacterium sp.]
MKKIIIHAVPVVISLMWLVTKYHTWNPVSLKGPDFLKFYLILILGFYTSVLVMKSLSETISTTTFYFLILIFALGGIKFIRGIILAKPIGFLVMILIIEGVVAAVLMSAYRKNKIK